MIKSQKHEMRNIKGKLNIQTKIISVEKLKVESIEERLRENDIHIQKLNASNSQLQLSVNKVFILFGF